MISRGAGKIVNICSVQTALARPGIAPYTATKGAVANLTKGMATDWARHGLQCNGLAPGYFDTPLNAALVKDAEFSEWLAKRTPAGALGQGRGTGRRLRLPLVGSVILRQRHDHLCRWRHNRVTVTGQTGHHPAPDSFGRSARIALSGDDMDIFHVGRQAWSQTRAIPVKQHWIALEARGFKLGDQMRVGRGMDHDAEIMRAVNENRMVVLPDFKRCMSAHAQRLQQSALDMAQQAEPQAQRIECPFYTPALIEPGKAAPVPVECREHKTGCPATEPGKPRASPQSVHPHRRNRCRCS